MNNSVKEHKNYIDGNFCPAANSLLEVYNPANGELLGYIPESDPEEVDRALTSARQAQKAWSLLPAIERAGYLHQIAKGIRNNSEHLATTIVREQGKILSLAEIEVEVTAGYFDYMAEWGRRIEGEIIQSDRKDENIFLFRKPLGVVAGILPWNFPFFLIARKMASALITGNTIVIKPSEETPLNAFLFAKIVHDVSLPAGVFNLVGGKGNSVGNRLAESPIIDMISFTGSIDTGSKIMTAAAANITKVNLELGGKAPAIVLPDADIDLAVKAIRDSRIINTGQVCNCAERVYLHKAVANQFLDKMCQAMSATRYGDPSLNSSLEMGPLINRSGLKKVDNIVQEAIRSGATVLTGGRIDHQIGGFHFQPTLLADCTDDMAIMRNEIFGPVLPVQIIEDYDEAIAFANDSIYGLTSSIYTNDLSTAMRACRDLNFGETYVNRENFEAIQGFHAGQRKSGLGGADGKHGLYENTITHMAYIDF